MPTVATIPLPRKQLQWIYLERIGTEAGLSLGDISKFSLSMIFGLVGTILAITVGRTNAVLPLNFGIIGIILSTSLLPRLSH